LYNFWYLYRKGFINKNIIFKNAVNPDKTAKIMSTEETDRIITLIKEALKERRSKEEIFETFKDAGIITKNGNLKSPYKEILIPAEK
jgi:hypothetical protein